MLARHTEYHNDNVQTEDTVPSPNQNQIIFFDTTLRDGEQSPGCTMHHEEKLRLAHQIAALGVDVLEAGFAIASDGDLAAIQAVAREVRGPRIASLARCKREDIEAAPSNRIHLVLASSDLHLEYKLRITRDEALDQTAESVRLARSFSEDVEFSTEDGTRSDPEFLLKMITVAVQAGATTINIPDTVGFTTPEEYAAIFRLIKARVPGIDDIVLSVHCHNDLGMAVANSLAGIEGGARQVECTINGIGERAGNAALEEVAAALMVRRDKFLYTNNIVLSQLYPTSQMLAECIAFGCSPNKAVVGANAFAHESGIHQHGMMADPLAYQIMTPESVGAGHTKFVLGKHSGRRALADRLEKLGHPLDRNQLDEVYARFIGFADRKKSIYDQDLLGILQPGKSIPIATA
jgi:2-isopropylmalate synthase